MTSIIYGKFVGNLRKFMLKKKGNTNFMIYNFSCNIRSTSSAVG